MGGEIAVNSTPGEGSCFTFTISVQSVPDAPVASDRGNRARAFDSSILLDKRVLVAEDNPINQQLALEFLNRLGASVDIAESGRHAVERIVETDYDLVLMDIHMPHTDGLEATRIIREQGLEVPIVAVSADALTERKLDAQSAGCDDYITKPIDFDTLVQTLEKLLPAAEQHHMRRASDRPDIPDDFDTDAENITLRGQRLPGIDIAEAIKKHNDNIKLMIKLMGDFGHYYGDAANKIRDHLAAGEQEEAERLAHNLHGVAGSFGAKRLKEASKALELAIAEDQTDVMLGHLHSFEIALSEVLESTEAMARNEVRLRASDFPEHAED